ncbi:MAG: hypothetical protein JNL13_05735 [Chitinophagaceae bacterium]|nr:hypothetical protein [Chitinophagaceae bacterium]
MKLTENDLLGAVNELKAKGFTDDFIAGGKVLQSTRTGKTYGEGDFTISNAYRFDHTEHVTDTQNLYVIETADSKGLLVDMLAEHLNEDGGMISRKIGTGLQQYRSEDQPMKYGMEKVHKARFEAQPGRYELRIGFPDFPPCPFGNAFRMLGYDKEAQKYVWLVTSILKDGRLTIAHHQS